MTVFRLACVRQKHTCRGGDADSMFAYPPPGSYLSPTERRVLRTRRHWAILFPQILLTVVIVAVLIVLSRLLSGVGAGIVVNVLWYGELIAVARLGILVLDWWDDLIMITDERILNVTGLLASRMKDTPINKITDRDIKHTVIGNILRYGTITIESAGHKSLQRLTFVPKPMTVYEAIVKLTSKNGLPQPAQGGEELGVQPSIEQKSREWPVDSED
jgi:uncharacterized membrane protein YdbT with pleckstrin-like domain